MEQKVEFKNKIGEKLAGILHIAEQNNDSIVIVCHGFTGGKNKNFIKKLSEEICGRKINVLRFDFSGYGESEGDFGKSSYGKQVNDLNSAVDFAVSSGYNKIGVIGHSMGGAVCILTASENEKINYLCGISPVGYPAKLKQRRFNLGQIKDAMKFGKVVWEDIHRKQFHTIYKEFFDDLEKHDVMKAASKLRIRCLVIHGNKDDTIPLNEGKEVFRNIGSDYKEFEVIEGADHDFWKKEDELVKTAADFFDKCINQKG